MNPFSSRCCQHNHTQGWPYYAENLWLATPENGLLAALYAESSVNARVGKGETVRLEQTTHYPFDETVRITVKESGPTAFPLYLRVPAWCRQATATVTDIHGKKTTIRAGSSRYIRILRRWSAGETVELSLPMHLSVDTWPQNGHSVSINYGPLTFSLRIRETYIAKNSAETAIGDSRWQKTADPSQWPSYEIHPASSWNYGLSFALSHPEEAFELVRKEWPADDVPFTVASVPWTLKAKGVRIPGWTIDQYGLCAFVPQSPVTTTEPLEDITLLPMGAARLRISAFPVIRSGEAVSN